jgi:hypothetical protein
LNKNISNFEMNNSNHQNNNDGNRGSNQIDQTDELKKFWEEENEKTKQQNNFESNNFFVSTIKKIMRGDEDINVRNKKQIFFFL